MSNTVTLNGIKWVKIGEDAKKKPIFALEGPIEAIRAAAQQGTAVVIKVTEAEVDATTVEDRGNGIGRVKKAIKTSEPTKAELQEQLQELRALLAAQQAPQQAPQPTTSTPRPTSRVIRSKK